MEKLAVSISMMADEKLNWGPFGNCWDEGSLSEKYIKERSLYVTNIKGRGYIQKTFPYLLICLIYEVNHLYYLSPDISSPLNRAC